METATLGLACCKSARLHSATWFRAISHAPPWPAMRRSWALGRLGVAGALLTA